MNIIEIPLDLFKQITSTHQASDFHGFSLASKKCRTIFFAVINEISCHSIEPKEAFINGISKFHTLRSIELPNNHQWASEIFPKLTALSIEKLTLSAGEYSRRTKITDSDLEVLSCITSLRALNLQGSSLITGKGVANLTTLEKMESLNLYGCQELTNDLIPFLSHFTSLQALTLSGCYKITPIGLRAFKPPASLTRLEMLFCHSMDEKARTDFLGKNPRINLIVKQ